MTKSGLDLRKEWPWLIIIILFVAGAIYFLQSHLGISLTASGVIELERDLIQVDGLLIAFTGIVFAGMLAEVRSRTERALQMGDNKLVEGLDRKSKALKRSALASFLLFAASLGDAIGNLPDALGSTFPTFSLGLVFVVPVLLLLGGLVFLTVALLLVASA